MRSTEARPPGPDRNSIARRAIAWRSAAQDLAGLVAHLRGEFPGQAGDLEGGGLGDLAFQPGHDAGVRATIPKPGQSWQAVGFEAIITFGLVLMVLNMANGPKLNGPFAGTWPVRSGAAPGTVPTGAEVAMIYGGEPVAPPYGTNSPGSNEGMKMTERLPAGLD